MDWNFLIKNKESLSISTDTRNLPAGCVFFALHGANFDGNKFAKQALEQGATLAVIDGKSIERLNSVLGVIEKGKGNVGLLINDEELYKSLDNSAKNLNKLIEDIKENPKKYINVSVF